MRVFVQDVQKSFGIVPQMLSQMIKESTDFLAKSFEKRNADLKIELLKNLNDALEKEMSSLKKQHLDNIFDTWNYLSDIKTILGEIQKSLDAQSNQSDDLKTKIEHCCNLVVDVQQRMEEKSGQIGNVENSKNLCQNTMDNTKQSLDESNSDDVFQVSILRTKSKKKLLKR